MGATSKRAQELGTENAFVVLGELGKLQAEGKDIVSFCIGQPDFPTPENICNAAIQAVRDGHHGYTASPGIPQLREAVAGFFSRTRGITVEPDDTVVALVKDNGRGVPLRYRHKIFQRFVRLGLELQREKPGTGLGLYIVHTLVRRLRGRIRVRDRGSGTGTVFEITLPGKRPEIKSVTPQHEAAEVA